jgi:hypothetical protein
MFADTVSVAFFPSLLQNAVMEKTTPKGFGWVLAVVLLLGGAGTAVWFSREQPAVAAVIGKGAEDKPAPAPVRPLPASSLENRPAAAPVTAPTPPPAPENTPRGVAALEEIDTVLRDQTVSTDAAAQRLVKLASDEAVPAEIRNEALQHAMNLLPDEAFNSVDGMIKAKSTPPELLDLLFHEIHNRPVDVQLPTAFLLMSERRGEEISQQARDLLSFHLEKDLGDDPTAWAPVVQQATAKARTEGAAR